MTAAPQLIDTTKAARSLRISPRRVRALIQSKRLPAELLGGRWVMKPSDLKRVAVRKPGRPVKK